ncbi:hypothetical protein [Desulfovibrio piger]|uniref:hypothetical protein n=1 Tax=Desulfovibrio piger TaxID=901 RepID=UPI003F0D5C1E
MAYRELNAVVFCGDKDCRKVYRFDGSDGSYGIRAGDILPCGHRVAQALLEGNLIREGHEAGLMLEWLYKNDAIKPNAYDLIEQHGGVFEDGLNFRVPESDLTEEERYYDLDAE